MSIEEDIFVFSTSNLIKQVAYRRLLNTKNIIVTNNGRDLDEISSFSTRFVAIYKAYEAGSMSIVEDTAMPIYLNGKTEPVVGTDIKWYEEELDQFIGCRAEWIVSIAKNNGKTIQLFEGKVLGTFAPPVPYGSSFDKYFVPDGTDKVVADLSEEELNEIYSPRKIASKKLLEGNYDYSIPTIYVEPWLGEWQNH